MATDPPGRFVVRPATELDLPGLLGCLALAFGPFRDRYTPEAYLHTVLNEELGRARLASMRVLVAVAGEARVVGTLSWVRTTAESGHLRGMAVVPEWQGSGVAQALLDRAVAEIREGGGRRVTLRTTEPLARAVRFYTRNGFRPSGTLADFHGMVVVERFRQLEDSPG